MTHPLRLYRQENGIKLKQLAERVNSSKSTLSRIESGLQQPSFALLRRLSDETGISADIFIKATSRAHATPAEGVA